MRESKIEEAVCKVAEADGWIVRKLTYMGRRNAPDRLFIRKGQVIFMEFKQQGGKPNPGQQREIERLRRAGALAFSIDSIDGGLRVLSHHAR